MAEQYVTRIHKQHTTCVSSVPKGVQFGLKIKPGDYLVWVVDRRRKIVEVSKVFPGGKRHADSKRDSVRKGIGRGT